MKELLLVRHAIACDRDLSRWRDDRARPLSQRGVARGRKAALGLRRISNAPQRVLVSPLLRTRQTAALLSAAAGWPEAERCEQLEPGVACAELLEALAAVDVTRVAAVGHEPGLGKLLAVCIGAGTCTAFEFGKMSVALVTFRAPVVPGSGTLAWFVPARVLRAAR